MNERKKKSQTQKQKGYLVELEKDIAYDEISSFYFILFNYINLLIWLQLVSLELGIKAIPREKVRIH